MGLIYTGTYHCPLDRNKVNFPKKLYETFRDRNIVLQDLTFQAVLTQDKDRFISLLDSRYLQTNNVDLREAKMLRLNGKKLYFNPMLTSFLMNGSDVEELVLQGNFGIIEVWNPFDFNLMNKRLRTGDYAARFAEAARLIGI